MSDIELATFRGHAISVDAAVEAVIEAGRFAAERRWVPATSGNFSVRIDAVRFAVTRSGPDKGRLQPADILILDLDEPLPANASAEAPLHQRLYRDNPGIGAIFHVHSLAATIIGRLRLSDGAVRLEGWELQKAFAGIRTHETVVEVPVFANSQDTVALSETVAARLAAAPSGAVAAPGYLLAGHGLYAWGSDAAEAARHLEAFDSLFSQELAYRSALLSERITP